MTRLKIKDFEVGVDAGELVSLKSGTYEYMHQKGDPGWGHTDTEMFPIIGPTDNANYKVKTEKDTAVQDQHGLLREMEYKLIKEDGKSATFKKEYKANTKVINSKFNKNQKCSPDSASHPEELHWPYDFTFEKKFAIFENGLEITFTIRGEKGMPFMLGYHPAFKIATKDALIKTEKCNIKLEEVLAVGSRALSILDCNKITLKDKKEITLETKGFNHFMCWTEVENMLCIEPITFYPYAVKQNNLDKGFITINDKKMEFSVKISI